MSQKQQRKILHLTDVHFDHCNYETIKQLALECVAKKPLAIVLTGDISNANDISDHLRWFCSHLGKLCVYIVLGNHDFYSGSIRDVRETVTNLASKEQLANLVYLFTCENPIRELTEDTAIVGADGFYDGGTIEDYSRRGVVEMNDYTLIRELSVAYSKWRWHEEEYMFNILQGLSKESARHIEKHLRVALLDSKYKKVVVATHVAPWAKNSVYKGKVSDWQWLPCFHSRNMGDAIISVVKDFPEKEVIVLCGHSHGHAVYKPLPNITSYTGEAEYKYPRISNIITI